MRSVKIARDSLCSRLVRISAMPNRPMTTGTRPTPSISSMRSKVRRGTALMESSPTKPSTRPRQAMMRALSREPCER